MRFSLPVLPIPATECARFVCARRHVDLTVGQCVGRYQAREDDACARDAHGELTPFGCPTGIEALKAIAGLLEGRTRVRTAARAARRAVA